MHAEPGTAESSLVQEDETATPDAARPHHAWFRTIEGASSIAACSDERSTEYDDHATQLGTRPGDRAQIAHSKR